MSLKNTLTKVGAVAAVATAAMGAAQAQSSHFDRETNLSISYRHADSGGHTLLLVSGIVLLVGLIDGDSTLTALGGIGVLVYIVEYDNNTYRFRPLARDGNLTFGVSTLGSTGFVQPRPYAQWTIKF